MRPFTQLTGVAAPLLRANVDTDAIIPSREMRRVSREGLGEGLFAGWRYRHADGRRLGLDPDFVLNRPEYAGATVLLAGANFGCGSSREHAVWALLDYGVRAVVAPSFGTIFYGNCLRNGLLPAQVTVDDLALLAAEIDAGAQGRSLHIDLTTRSIRAPSGSIVRFDIDGDGRRRLLAGVDEIDESLQHGEALERFLEGYRERWPWALLDRVRADGE